MKNLITEQFLTIQGEGRSVGQLAYFIRFAGCNLWCGWCDSMHSVDPKLFRGKTQDIDCSQVPDHCALIVLTGGEPALFDLMAVKKSLQSQRMNFKRVFEVESNATVFPQEIVDEFHWNLSPKLKSSHQKNAQLDGMRLQSLQRWADYAKTHSNVIFKFVVSGHEDQTEILDLVKNYQLPKERIYLMAEGQTPKSQQLPAVQWILDFCKQEGFNFSPRLHVMFWGDRRGV